MCGIVGMIGNKTIADDLIAALSRMEYRGYDSAGIGLVGGGAPLTIHKVVGSASGLRKIVQNEPGTTGIAHTRWATHGKPEVKNAHPFRWGTVAAVHNGIIENHAEIRSDLSARGHNFESDTDSEVIPHLIFEAIESGLPPLEALREACFIMEGAWAIAAIFDEAPDTIVVAKKGSPLILAKSPELLAVGSDPSSLGGYCTEFLRLEDGDVAEISPKGIHVFGSDFEPRMRAWQTLENHHSDAGHGNYEHHTRREIAQQSEALVKTVAGLSGLTLPESIISAERLLFIACGSSLYAAATARSYVERATSIPCDIEIASEFRYREAPIVRGTVAVFISQSGETADTMAALEMMKASNVKTVAVVNVPDSSIAHAADVVWPTTAGKEFGVAATKTFSCQMLAILNFGLTLAKQKGMTSSVLDDLENAIEKAAETCAAAELSEQPLIEVADRIAKENEAIFIGRGWGASIADEGALKLKELSYLPAAAYPAGELKHGPIALIREGTPIIVHMPSDSLMAKTLSNAQEVRARGAHVVALTDSDGAARASEVAHEVIVLPGVGAMALFSHAVAVQLLAYHTAIALGRNVDRPRNLAKSVTVE